MFSRRSLASGCARRYDAAPNSRQAEPAPNSRRHDAAPNSRIGWVGDLNFYLAAPSLWGEKIKFSPAFFKRLWFPKAKPLVARSRLCSAEKIGYALRDPGLEKNGETPLSPIPHRRKAGKAQGTAVRIPGRPSAGQPPRGWCASAGRGRKSLRIIHRPLPERREFGFCQKFEPCCHQLL